MKNKSRPKHLNLFKIHFPITAVASILHRASGAFLFLLTPLLIYYFARTLQRPDTFASAMECLQSPLANIVFILIFWSVLHHLLMGLRFLFIDFDIGVDLKTARLSAWIVSAMAALLTIFYISRLIS